MPAKAPITPLVAADNPCESEAEADGVACTVVAATVVSWAAGEVWDVVLVV